MLSAEEKLALVQRIVGALARNMASGLSGETKEEVEARVLSVDTNPVSGDQPSPRASGQGSASSSADRHENTEKLLVTIRSDGLVIGQKAWLETQLLDQLQEALGRPISVNFKRLKGQPGPVRSVKSRAPFGLNINKRAIPGVGQIIAVASGKGGVGKSTVSVNLAVTLAKLGARVGLLDADIYGPSCHAMLGLSGILEVSANQKLLPKKTFGVSVVSFGFLTNEREPVIWRGPMISKALRQLCFDTEWGDLDYLIVDLPPGTGDIQLELIERIPLGGAVVVSTPQNIAVLDAYKAVSMFRKLEIPLKGVVENMAMYHCPSCGEEDDLFGSGGGKELEKVGSGQLIARIPLLRQVREGGDQGRPVCLDDGDGPVAKAFETLAKVLMN